MEVSTKTATVWTVITVLIIAVAALLAVAGNQSSAPRQLFPDGYFIWPYGEAAFRDAAAHNFNLYR